MNTAWIDIATRMGATVRINCYDYYVAKVTWNGTKDAVTVTDDSLEKLIEKLNTALQEDAADEMVKNGDV